MNYAWACWVLNFDSDAQNSFLRGILGKIIPQRMLIAVILMGGLPLAFAAFFSLRGPTRRGAARYYLRSCRELARRVLKRKDAETPEDSLGRVSVEQPCWAAWLGIQTRLFTECSYYSEQNPNYKQNLQKLKRYVNPRKWAEKRLVVGWYITCQGCDYGFPGSIDILFESHYLMFVSAAMMTAPLLTLIVLFYKKQLSN
jgi:hypothetical protein